jgi:hypothetical protein
MLVQVDILEKAVNELDKKQVKAAAEQDAKHVKAVAESEAKQSAAMQLLQTLQTQMTELRHENQALRARLEEERATMSTQLQEVRAHNQALAARLNAELELPRSASGASRPATLEELIQRRDALAKIKAAKMDCVMVKAAGYTCAEAKQAGFNPRECMQAGFAFLEGQAAGYRPGDGIHKEQWYWSNGKAPAENRTQVDPACGPAAGVVSSRCGLTPARARGVLAWRRREL